MKKKGGLTVEAIPSSSVRLGIVQGDHAIPADSGSGGADCRIRVVVAGFCDVETAGEIGGHDVAAGGVEDWLVDAWVGGAEGFPVSEASVEG